MSYQWAICRYAGEMLPGYEGRELPEALGEREPIPNDVFCFPAVASWRDRLWELLSDLITDEVKEAFKRNPPEYVVSDDLTWLNDIVRDVTGVVVEMKELTADRLASEYRAFRAGHASRTNNLAQFYESGLRYLRAQDVEAKARELFLSGDFHWATEEKLQAAINDLDARNSSGGREGRLYFCADERSLVTPAGMAGHYLVYGSEYLYCLGTRLVGKTEAHRILKSVGRPTMFVCDIPIRLMREWTVREFAGLILEFLFCELIGDTSHALSPGAGSALSLTVDLPGQYIIGHYHPVYIYDPF
jgi:hypothetical protein